EGGVPMQLSYDPLTLFYSVYYPPVHGYWLLSHQCPSKDQSSSTLIGLSDSPHDPTKGSGVVQKAKQNCKTR
ncbi:hypothetical protein FRC02_003656, partial [Tulasnella sp. 418]